MSYRIELARAAMRALKKLPEDVRQRIAVVIDDLADNPCPGGVQKLRGSDDIYRVRSGEYRILYQIVDRELLVLVVDVGHRRDVYRR